MNKDEMKHRTKQFALKAMKVVDHPPRSIKGRVLADQLMRRATSVAANYRSACRARSTAEFSAKLGTALEEADESALWLELILEDRLYPADGLDPLLKEANELCAILYTSRRSAQQANAKS